MKIMKNLTIISGLALVLSFSSCTMTYPGQATSNRIEKTGEASKTIFLGLAFGHTDLGIEKAAKDAKITKIATMDYSVKMGLITQKYTLIISGE